MKLSKLDVKLGHIFDKLKTNLEKSFKNSSDFFSKIGPPTYYPHSHYAQFILSDIQYNIPIVTDYTVQRR